MWLTVLLASAAGMMGANAVPHFVKGMVGEQFPNVWGNSALRNAVAGTLGLTLAATIGYWADLGAHTMAGIAGASAGALAMAVFHGLRGAYRLNTALGLPNPL
ncbi:hypothetical protein [Nocardia aobensis]|uniref:hypothetical protein n=1 Tax=Nocardia aobensis TaxID=257277 RepID=UPI00055CE4D2|nr:hypothetical protein [Nocardia aobensis]